MRFIFLESIVSDLPKLKFLYYKHGTNIMCFCRQVYQVRNNLHFLHFHHQQLDIRALISSKEVTIGISQNYASKRIYLGQKLTRMQAWSPECFAISDHCDL